MIWQNGGSHISGGAGSLVFCTMETFELLNLDLYFGNLNFIPSNISLPRDCQRTCKSR